MLDNAGNLSSVRKFRGIACAMIAPLEAQISKLQDKPEIAHSDSVMIQAYMERLNSLDSDFQEHRSPSLTW